MPIAVVARLSGVRA